MVHLISLGCNFRRKLKIGHFSTLGGNKIIDSKRLSVTGQQSFSQLNRIMPGFTLSSVIFCQQFFVKVESPWTKMLCQTMWSPMHTCSSADLNWPTLVGLHSQHDSYFPFYSISFSILCVVCGDSTVLQCLWTCLLLDFCLQEEEGEHFHDICSGNFCFHEASTQLQTVNIQLSLQDGTILRAMAT